MTADQRFSREQARVVFRRAAEIDADATEPDPAFDDTTLRDIGREAGFAPESVEQATAELLDEPQPEPPAGGWDVIVSRTVYGAADEHWMRVDRMARRGLLELAAGRPAPDTVSTWTRRRGLAPFVTRRVGPRSIRLLMPLELLEFCAQSIPGAPGLSRVAVRGRLVRPGVLALSAMRQSVLAAGALGGVVVTANVFDAMGTPEVFVAAGGSVFANGYLARKATQKHAQLVDAVEASIERLLCHA